MLDDDNFGIRYLAERHRRGLWKGDRRRLPSAVAKSIADAHEAAVHTPHDPAVVAAYAAFIRETRKQYKLLVRAGYSFEPWLERGEPYVGSRRMIRDVHERRHLYVFLGGEPPADHPLSAMSGVGIGGTEVTCNILFRIVHDCLAHCQANFGFGPHGEENAWRVHVRHYGKLARYALATETRGQNWWINAGKHLRNADGSMPARTDPGFVPLRMRPFAAQKAAILPEWCQFY